MVILSAHETGKKVVVFVNKKPIMIESEFAIVSGKVVVHINTHTCWYIGWPCFWTDGSVIVHFLIICQATVATTAIIRLVLIIVTWCIDNTVIGLAFVVHAAVCIKRHVLDTWQLNDTGLSVCSQWTFDRVDAVLVSIKLWHSVVLASNNHSSCRLYIFVVSESINKQKWTEWAGKPLSMCTSEAISNLS